MAQIDTSIYSRVGTGGSLGGLVTGAMQGMQLKSAQKQVRQQEKAIAEQQTLRDIIKSNTGADGAVNRQGVVSGLAQGGLGDQIPTYQKQWADSDKSITDQKTSQFKLAKEKIDYTNGAISSLLSDQSLTHDKVISHATSLVQQGIMTPQEGEQFVRTLPGNPEHLRGYLTQLGMQGLDAAARMKMLTPNIDAINLGGKTQMVDKNTFTNPTIAGQSFQRTATPGELETGRHNRTTEGLAHQRLAFDQAQPKGQVVDTPSGLMIVDPRSGQASPVMAAEGKPLAGKAKAGADAANQEKVTLGQSTIASIDRNIGYIDRLLDNKDGLNGITGSIYSRKPTYTMGNKQLAAHADLDSIKSKVVLNTMNEMRAASSAGATGFGNMSNQQLKVIEDSLGSLDRAQTFDQITANLKIIRNAMANLRDKANGQIQSAGGNVSESTPQESTQQQDATPVQAPQRGAMMDGYAFMGGDPADKKNWKKVSK